MMLHSRRILLASVAAASFAIGYAANLTTTPARAAGESQAKSSATSKKG